MKQRPICILTCAMLGLGGPLITTTTCAQDAKVPASVSADEKTAIAAYTEAVKEAVKLNREDPGVAENPAEAIAFTDKMEKILDSVKTDGLPADLGKAFGGFRTSVKKMSAHAADLPVPKELLTDQSKIRAWVVEQAAANPSFLPDFQEKMSKLQESVLTLRKESRMQRAALDALHKKYAIDVDLYPRKEGAKKANPAANKEEKDGNNAGEETELKKEAKPKKEKAKEG